MKLLVIFGICVLLILIICNYKTYTYVMINNKLNFWLKETINSRLLGFFLLAIILSYSLLHFIITVLFRWHCLKFT